MSRYIDIDKLKKKKKYCFQTQFGAFPKHEYFIKLQDLFEAPTADVEEVRHGMWLGEVNRTTYYCARCSNCGLIAPCLSYCGMCGTRMEIRRKRNDLRRSDT